MVHTMETLWGAADEHHDWSGGAPLPAVLRAGAIFILHSMRTAANRGNN